MALIKTAFKLMLKEHANYRINAMVERERTLAMTRQDSFMM